MAKKIQNAGDARPQSHDAMTIDASKPMRETVSPDGYTLKVEPSSNPETRTYNAVDAS
jgi:hypothetical protein